MTALRIHSGTLESLKWLGLAAMVVDHINAVFFARELGLWATVIGRGAFPLFACVVGFNLARPSVRLDKSLQRFALFGVLAFPAYAYLFGQVDGWWPLNVLATLGVGVGVVALWRSGYRPQAALLFVGGGVFVEYLWPGVGLVVASWAFARRPGRAPALGLAAALLGLCVINGNAWALLALPLLAGARFVEVGIPRHRWAFWVAYPAHLSAIAAVAYLYG